VISIKIKRRVKSEPQKQIATFLILLVVIVVIFFAALAYFLNKGTPLSSSAYSSKSSLLYSMRMNKTHYGVGEPIEFIMEVRNVGYKPVMMKFDESLEYDFLVQKQKNLLFVQVPMDVWRFSANQAVHSRKRTITIQPQEVRIYKGVWEQIDSANRQVGTGNYSIKGFINTSGKGTELQLRGRMGGK